MDNMDHHNQFSQLQDPFNALNVVEPGSGCDPDLTSVLEPSSGFDPATMTVAEMGSGLGDRANPQWSTEETRDFLLIRAELDPNFLEMKRNRALWDLVSNRMAEFGYNRTPIQCKYKWKNLVTRYKGCETMPDVDMRQSSFPFYNDMQVLLNAQMERLLWQEVEGGGIGIGLATAVSPPWMPAAESPPPAPAPWVRDFLEAYMSQQIEMEARWMQMYDEREERRSKKEAAWRKKLVEAESEWRTMARRWKERDEERKARGEGRAERRDALVTALLNKLKDDGNL